MFNLKKKIEKYKEKKYYERRAIRWKRFKTYNKDMECGLVKNPCRSWEKDCYNCCYDKDFFDKYGCIYIKGFEKY